MLPCPRTAIRQYHGSTYPAKATSSLYSRSVDHGTTKGSSMTRADLELRIMKRSWYGAFESFIGGNFLYYGGQLTVEQEDLNLIALAAEARVAIGQNQVLNVLNRPSAVTIIVKKPCVAVRYPAGQGQVVRYGLLCYSAQYLTSDQIRRFQIRFIHDTDYYAAMGRFSEANAPVTEAGTFPTPPSQPRQCSSSSSVLCPSNSIFHPKAQSTSTPPILPSEKCSTILTSNILNGAETLLRPTISGPSTRQGSTPSCQRPQTMASGVYDRQSRGDIYALPHELHETSPIYAEYGPTTSQYWKDGHGLMQLSDISRKGAQASNKPTSSSILSAPVTGFSHQLINLYKPRPSTAPVIESQGLSDMLPPKRDLPFPNPVPGNRSKVLITTKGTAETTLPVLAPKDANQFPASFIQPFNSQELETQSAPPTANPRKGPAKNAARVTKKPAATRPRKKAVRARPTSPIPSVEELLRRSQESAKDVTKLSTTIDTQALLARVEERQALATCPDPVDKHKVGPGQEATVVPQPGQSRASVAQVLLPGGKQVMEISMYEEPTPQAQSFQCVTTIHGPLERNHNSPQVVPATGHGNPPDLPFTAPQSPSVRRPLSAQPQSIAPAPSKPAVQPLVNPITGPLTSLLRDPDVAGFPDLVDWAKDPEAERHISLETWICRNIQDENFFKLCKELTGTWQRMFLGKIS